MIQKLFLTVSNVSNIKRIDELTKLSFWKTRNTEFDLIFLYRLRISAPRLLELKLFAYRPITGGLRLYLPTAHKVFSIKLPKEVMPQVGA